jgi:hypothetical protein
MIFCNGKVLIIYFHNVKIMDLNSNIYEYLLSGYLKYNILYIVNLLLYIKLKSIL